MMDLVSGAEVPAEEIAVTPAMIEAGRLELWGRVHIADRLQGQAGSEELVVAIWSAMERARRDEAPPTFGPEWRKAKMASYNGGELIPIERSPPPGYRSASEDEPERDGDAGMRK